MASETTRVKRKHDETRAYLVWHPGSAAAALKRDEAEFFLNKDPSPKFSVHPLKRGSQRILKLALHNSKLLQKHSLLQTTSREEEMFLFVPNPTTKVRKTLMKSRRRRD